MFIFRQRFSDTHAFAEIEEAGGKTPKESQIIKGRWKRQWRWRRRGKRRWKGRGGNQWHWKRSSGDGGEEGDERGEEEISGVGRKEVNSGDGGEKESNGGGDGVGRGEERRWSDKGDNYADPVYGVATICHQVRCLRWGHPRLFDTATSLLIWYKMFCMRDMSYRPTWMKFINMLSVYTQSGTHRRVNWWIIAVLT